MARNKRHGYSLTRYLDSHAELGAAEILQTNLCLHIMEGAE